MHFENKSVKKAKPYTSRTGTRKRSSCLKGKCANHLHHKGTCAIPVLYLHSHITKVYTFVICECRYKAGMAQVPVWCRWLAYLPFTQDTRVRVPVREVYGFAFVYCSVLKVHCSHRQAHTIYPQQQGKNRFWWWYLFTTHILERSWLAQSKMAKTLCYLRLQDAARKRPWVQL